MGFCSAEKPILCFCCGCCRFSLCSPLLYSNANVSIISSFTFFFFTHTAQSRFSVSVGLTNILRSFFSLFFFFMRVCLSGLFLRVFFFFTHCCFDLKPRMLFFPLATQCALSRFLYCFCRYVFGLPSAFVLIFLSSETSIGGNQTRMQSYRPRSFSFFFLYKQAVSHRKPVSYPTLVTLLCLSAELL